MSTTCKKEEKMSEKRMFEFFAGISHEIRNALNGIIGITHLLGSTPSEEDRQKYIQTLIISSEGLLGLVNNIMELSKIEVTETTLNLKAVHLRKTINENLLSQKFLAEEKGLSLNIEIDDRVPDFVLIDEIKLNQVLLNLVSNAVKFTEKGAISVVVSAVEFDHKKSVLRFIVQDTGIGIPAEKLESIFDPFDQGREDTGRKYGGTGLGLSISKKIVEVMGGNLQARSQSGMGSEFTFQVLLEEGSSFGENSGGKMFRPSKALANKKVLVVEDNRLNVLVLKKNLENWGLAYEVAYNGLNAVRKVQEQDFDLILMDLHMPGMNGLEAVQVIRNLSEQKYQALPILGLSAAPQIDFEELVGPFGFNEILTKPYTAEGLYNKIFSYTGRKQVVPRSQVVS